MTGKEFMNAVAHGKIDLVRLLLDILVETEATYCVIGGLAVNAYAEPVVSLDLDIVLAMADIGRVEEIASARGLKAETFPHSLNLSTPQSELRIQIQTDPLYQEFLARARDMNVLGYDMKVAAIQDVLQGKLWAYQDKTRRQSKRQKDLADIMRLVEAQPALLQALPNAVRALF